MLWQIFRSVCRNAGGLVLVAGAIGVLTGVEHLMSAPGKKPKPQVAKPKPVFIQEQSPAPIALPRTDYFDIRRTKFALSYTYWVLQGHGKHSCFVLLDTWREAMDEAALRLKNASAAAEDQLVAVTVGNRLSVAN